MMRIFGLIVALAAFVAPAQAALLTYSFDGNADGVVSPASAGTASAFGLSGTLGSGATAGQWNLSGLGTRRNSGFSFTAGSTPVSLTDIFVSGKRGGAQAGKTAEVSVYYNIGASSTGISGTYLGASTLGANFATFPFSVNQILAAGQKIHFTISAGSTNGYTSTAAWDFVTLDGNVVPEPTSMAVFGLLGAGIAARRIRRKA
jgi:hypothetical protein